MSHRKPHRRAPHKIKTLKRLKQVCENYARKVTDKVLQSFAKFLIKKDSRLVNGDHMSIDICTAQDGCHATYYKHEFKDEILFKIAWC